MFFDWNNCRLLHYFVVVDVAYMKRAVSMEVEHKITKFFYVQTVIRLKTFEKTSPSQILSSNYWGVVN